MGKGKTAIVSTLGGAVIGAVAGIVTIGKLMGKSVEEKMALSDKHLALFLMMNQWVKVKQQGRNLSSYFEKNGYKKIAIYGMSYAGETLLDELRNTGVEVAYGIDKNAEKIYAEGIEVVTMEAPLDKVDAVVVTAISFLDEIEEYLSIKMDCPIISLNEILHEV